MKTKEEQAVEYQKEKNPNNNSLYVGDIQIAFLAGWDACLASDEVRGLIAALEHITESCTHPDNARDFVDGKCVIYEHYMAARALAKFWGEK